MTGSMRCAACQNELLMGATQGRVMCPACGQVVGGVAGREGSSRWPGGEDMRRTTWYWTRLALLTLGLGLSVIVVDRVSHHSDMMYYTGDTRSSGNSPGGGDADWSDLKEVILAYQHFNGRSDPAWILKCLERYTIDSRLDQQDFGVQWELAAGWREWVDEMSGPGHKSEDRVRIWSSLPVLARSYNSAAAAPHTRRDGRLLAQWRAWFREVQKDVGPAPDVSLAEPSHAIMGPPVHVSVIRRSTPAPGNRDLAERLDLQELLDLQERLGDTIAVQKAAPASAYGWRMHAETLIEFLSHVAPGRLSTASWQTMEKGIALDLQETMTRSHSKAALGLVTEDHFRAAALQSAIQSRVRRAAASPF